MVRCNLRAIILAAGEGVRLRPHTLTRPKCLVEVNGVSLLDRQLAVLRAEGITDVTLVAGYRADQLEGLGGQVRVNEAFAATNMVWSLFCADDQLEGDVLISYGDIVYSRDALRAVVTSTADIAVAIDRDWEGYWAQRNENPLDDAETLRLKSDGSLAEIGQVPTSLDQIEGQYIGLIKVSSTGVQLLRSFYRAARSDPALLTKPVEKAYMTDLLQAIVVAGHRVEAVAIHGGWVEVDTVADLGLEITRSRIEDIQDSLSNEEGISS